VNGLICSECKSVVDKTHLINKRQEHIAEKKNIEEQKAISEGLKITKDKEIKDAKDKLQKINEYLVKESQMNSELKAYEDGKKNIEELNEQLKQMGDWTSIVANEISDIELKIKEYDEKLNSIKSICEKDIELLKQRINELVGQLKNAETDARVINEQIEECKLKQKLSTENRTKNLEKNGYLDKEKEGYEAQKIALEEKKRLLHEEAKILQRFLCLEDVFGLDGIQTMIVKKYLPLLNVYIKEFLDILSNGLITVKMIINDKSKVDMVISGGTADTFDMLSGGEQMIVRLATDIGLALLAFSKSAQKPELICLDEIFSPLDKSHTDAVFKMLKKLQDKFNRVLIISHKTEIKDMLKTNIIIEKSGGKMGMSEIRRIE
jgi:DNA repair exonuclease SbcCD ATPase subunit